MDADAARRAAANLLAALGADLTQEDLRETPCRMFQGVAHLAYLPNERIIGLSKLGRVVEHFARDPQIQERMTTQVAGWLERELEPKGAGVVLEAEHLCMSCAASRNSAPRP